MSSFINLIKQIPPGTKEIPSELLKELDTAAAKMVRNRGGQYELSDEEKREHADFTSYVEEDDRDRDGDWGLREKCPLRLGELGLFKDDMQRYYIGISFAGNAPAMLDQGNKTKMTERLTELNEFRETAGEAAFEDEVMRRRDSFLRQTRWE